MRNRIIATLSFIIMIGSVLLIRFNPGLFDFNIIHNIFGPNIFLREHMSAWPLYIGIFSIALTLLLGPIFCGYICPFGSFQRFMHYLGHKIGINKRLSIKTHQNLSSIKYLILIVFVYSILVDKVMMYINIDVYHGFIRLFFGGITISAGIYLLFITITSFMIYRPFCNYLCPYGASLNLISSFRVLRVTRYESECVHCNMCNHACPTKIEITKETTVKDPNCLSCHRCLDVCPQKGAINLRISKLGLHLSIFVIIVLIMTLKVQTLPEISDDFEIQVETQVPEIKEVLDDELPLKENPTEDYYSNDIDFIPVEITDEKNAAALIIHQEALRIEAEKKAEEERIAKEEADRLAKEEADRLAKEEADRIAQEQAKSKYNDGTYKAKVNGYQPDMVVQIVIKDDIISSVEILEHDESRSYYNYSVPKVIKQILDNNSTDVDIIAGCTYTSRGVINGVKACLNKAKK